MREALLVLRKEAVDYGRDRSSQIARVVLVIVTLLVIVVPQYLLPRQLLQALFEPVHIGVFGADAAPALMAYLAEQQIVVSQAPDDPIAAVQSGGVDLVLLVQHHRQA